MVIVLLVPSVVVFVFLLVLLVLVVISFFIFLLYGKPSGASTNALLWLLGSRNKVKHSEHKEVIILRKIKCPLLHVTF